MGSLFMDLYGFLKIENLGDYCYSKIKQLCGTETTKCVSDSVRKFKTSIAVAETCSMIQNRTLWKT